MSLAQSLTYAESETTGYLIDADLPSYASDGTVPRGYPYNVLRSPTTGDRNPFRSTTQRRAQEGEVGRDARLDDAAVTAPSPVPPQESGQRLITLRFGDRALATRSSPEYRDMERTARRLFPIGPTARVTFSAAIPSFGEGKHDIDELVWPTVQGEIREMWVREDWPLTRRTIKVYHRTEFSGMKLEVDDGWTVGDLKEAVRKHPLATLKGNKIRIYPPAWQFWTISALPDDAKVLGSSYSYDWVDP